MSLLGYRINKVDVNILGSKKVDFDRFLIVVMWAYENDL